MKFSIRNLTFAAGLAVLGMAATQARAQGAILSWGQDEWGAVINTPSGNNFVQVSGGFWFSAALRSDHTVVAWGEDTYGQSSFYPTDANYKGVWAGGDH